MERTHHTLEFVGPRQQTSPKIGRETLMRTGMRSIGIVVLVVTGGFLGSIIFESDVANAQTPHAPIYIDGNESFTAANGVTRGKGTPRTPSLSKGGRSPHLHPMVLKFVTPTSVSSSKTFMCTRYVQTTMASISSTYPMVG